MSTKVKLENKKALLYRLSDELKEAHRKGDHDLQRELEYLIELVNDDFQMNG